MPSVHAATRLFTENIKVTGVKTLMIDNIPPYAGQAKWLFVQLLTDQGVIGLGERPTGGIPNLEPQISLIHDLCERYVIGENPFNVEKIWQKIYAGVHDYRHPGLYATPALSAIEGEQAIALVEQGIELNEAVIRRQLVGERKCN